MSKVSSPWSRRHFLSTSAAGLGGLNLLTPRKSVAATANGVVIGEGEHRYEVLHDWVVPPAPYTWQTTHNVAVDSQNRLYVIHEGRVDQPEHPSIFVFDEKGRFIKAFGGEFQGGGHGLEVRKEQGGEFLYVTGYQHLKKPQGRGSSARRRRPGQRSAPVVRSRRKPSAHPDRFSSPRQRRPAWRPPARARSQRPHHPA